MNNRMSDADSSSSQSTAKGPNPVDVSPKMVAWAIEEVKHKAQLFEKTNFNGALDGVWKFDTNVDEELKGELQSVVKPLENVLVVGHLYSSSHPHFGIATCRPEIPDWVLILERSPCGRREIQASERNQGSYQDLF